MTQKDRRILLILELIKERPEYSGIIIPENEQKQKKLLRSLFNTREPNPVSDKFIELQNAYLLEEVRQRGIKTLSDLTPVRKGIYLWQGDITTLKIDSIVNAANKSLLGCFIPCHYCVDNIIHSISGVQLRLACNKIMAEQGYDEPPGKAKITPAFNLPCRYVIHTVGPIVSGKLTEKHCTQLAECYKSCLKLASENQLESIAFCCISTGEFHFPQKKAAEIAIQTVTNFVKTNNRIKVIFNVFKQKDYDIYKQILG